MDTRFPAPTRRTLARALCALAFCALFPAPPVRAADLPPGLVSASLLPGSAQPDGSILTALALELEPGWKTYWRSPGEAGIAPVFDWSGAANVASATPLWPRPEVIDTEGTPTLGFHGGLVLPIRLTRSDPTKPVGGAVTVDLGLCLNICVPAHLRLAAPAEQAASPDPRIAQALARAPRKGDGPARCSTTPIADGLRVAVSVPAPQAPAPTAAAAIEVDAAGMWVSGPDLTRTGDTVTAAADVVGPTGKPFALDPALVRLTLIGDDGAVEYQGCTGS